VQVESRQVALPVDAASPRRRMQERQVERRHAVASDGVGGGELAIQHGECLREVDHIDAIGPTRMVDLDEKAYAGTEVLGGELPDMVVPCVEIGGFDVDDNDPVQVERFDVDRPTPPPVDLVLGVAGGIVARTSPSSEFARPRVGGSTVSRPA
jgi:hypothetical protein